MDSKTKTNLELAKSYAYSMRMADAYNILRRYYDRLPFQAEPEHAEYIGIFVRVLSELGKDYELKFYLRELEKLNETLSSAAIKYQLASVYCSLPEPRWEACRKMAEDVLRTPGANLYHAKAKMLLACYYDVVKADNGTCRTLIDSIGKLEDEELSQLVEVWKAKVLRSEKKYQESEKILSGLIQSITPETNWYAYFSAMLGLIHTYLEQGQSERATPLVAELRTLFESRRFKTVMVRVEALEKILSQGRQMSNLKLSLGESTSKLMYENKSLSLLATSPSDRLMITLAKKRFITKAGIVRALYSRSYESQTDNKLIYYHIHTLRKRLSSIGLPTEAIKNESEGYRLVPKVDILEDEL